MFLSRPLSGFIETKEVTWADPNYKPLALLRSCRKIYAEAIGYLYTSNTFFVSEPLALFDLGVTTLSWRFRSIRSLRLCLDIQEFSRPLHNYQSYTNFPVRLQPVCTKYTWNKLWEYIYTDLVGLETLEVVLHAKSWNGESGLMTQLDIFRPMSNMQEILQIPNFRVMICFPMTLDRELNLVRDAKFKIQCCNGLDELHLLLKENGVPAA